MIKKDCVFCKIINNEIAAQRIIDNKELIVIKDISPKAPIHYLIIPKEHATRAHKIKGDFFNLLPATLNQLIALNDGLKNSYKLVINNGPEAGQEIDHLHIHVLAGKKFGV
jgi:histidine triad (HIT) family protein